MINLESFWQQPCEGFNEKTRGRTDKEIADKEEQIGFKFPTLYKDLMKLQNGGHTRKEAYNLDEFRGGIIINGSVISPIEVNNDHYNNLYEILSEYLDEEEIKQGCNSEFCYLNRLPILSHLDGHQALCFDYGYKEEFEKQEPEICLFELECAENGFEERLRVKSFEEFANNLCYSGYGAEEYKWGIISDEDIETISKKISSKLNIELQEKNDNYYGWFNFDKYYLSEFEFDQNLSFILIFSPNKFKSQTYLFQDYPKIDYIIQIRHTYSNNITTETVEIPHNIINQLIESGLNVKELLIPNFYELK